MTDTHRIDSHKLMMHPIRVARWQQSCLQWDDIKGVYPLYMEISPIGACNHRCIFCALDYMEYKSVRLPIDIMGERFKELASCGVKSVMFAGEGEPLLHPHMDKMVADAVDSGLDVALTSNGVLMNKTFTSDCLAALKWIKISFNAGTPGTYARLHKTKEGDFHRVVSNLQRAVDMRREKELSVTIGMQLLLLPENASEVETLARIARDEIGLDYLVVKPYSQHLHSLTKRYQGLSYGDYLGMRSKLERLSNNDFDLIFRSSAMHRNGTRKTYRQCYSTPVFWGYVQSDGSVYTCSTHLGDSRFRIGNLIEQSFREIWESKARQENFRLVLDHLDVAKCRINCRMDACNRYLWELMHPGEHVNFI
jgi:GTP 3',8-cyclase